MSLHGTADNTSEQTPTAGQESAFTSLARNVGTKYLAYVVDAGLGLVMLPFNLEHLGKPMYGLWALTAAMTSSFALLDLGYGGSLVRFIARYRALRDTRSLNEILSTLAVVYAAIGVATLLLALLMVPFIDRVFALEPWQVGMARQLLLIISVYVAGRFAFSVYGGVIVGFQRYDLNNMVSVIVSLAVAAVNVAVLLGGGGLVALVAATTGVRLLGLLLYRRNAFRVYPGLRLRLSEFSRPRLREVSGFSFYMLLLQLGQTLNYSVDTLVVGAFLGPAAVAMWAPAQRLSHLMIRLTNQLNAALFPVVVDSDASQRTDRLRAVFIHGTRVSLAMAIAIAGTVAVAARPLIHAWIGPSFEATGTILQLLAFLVVLRIGTATSGIILQGAGEHERLTAYVGVTGLANLALSIVLVKRFGLYGVALGSIVPVALMAGGATFPRACRRVGLSFWAGLREAIWPATWPMAPAALWLHLALRLREWHGIALLVQLAVAVAIYAAFFYLAIGHTARAHYVGKIRQLLPRAPFGAAAIAAPQPEGRR
jgi:O-antigen/teichoic acid export membrane protein